MRWVTSGEKGYVDLVRCFAACVNLMPRCGAMHHPVLSREMAPEWQRLILDHHENASASREMSTSHSDVCGKSPPKRGWLGRVRVDARGVASSNPQLTTGSRNCGPRARGCSQCLSRRTVMSCGSDGCPFEFQNGSVLGPLDIFESNWNDTSPEFIARLERMRKFERKLLRGEQLSGPFPLL